MHPSVRAALLVCAALAAAACSGDPTGPSVATLTPGVAVSVSGGEDSERTFRIVVPAGTPGINVTLTGGSGDADLYLRFGQRPTPDVYDCGSESFGGDEICFIPNPEAGSWYVVVYGFEAYSGISLLASFGSGPTATPLTTGVPLTNLAGPENSLRFFSITVPAGATALNVTTAGGTGDADLFVLRDFEALASECASTTFDTNDEVCNIANPVAGTWYVAVQGFLEYAGVTLTATVSVGATVTTSGAEISSLKSNATLPPASRALRARTAAADGPRRPKRTR